MKHTPRESPIDWPAAFRSAAIQVAIGVGVIVAALGGWWLAITALR